MPALRDQAGAALVVALLMLAVLALLGVNAVNNSTVNLRIIFNMQAHQDVEAAAQDAIEQVISTIASFNNPDEVRTFTVDEVISVTVSERRCLDVRPAEGYSAAFALAPVETHWDVRAAANDDTTGAQANMRQGVAITLPAGACS
jgi:Tfp pilus assembly protein PilX